MLELASIEANDRIKYVGDSHSFGGSYTVLPAEATYEHETDVPFYEKGKLLIIELTNDDRPIFFFIETLNLSEWVKVAPTNEQEVEK